MTEAGMPWCAAAAICLIAGQTQAQEALRLDRSDYFEAPGVNWLEEVGWEAMISSIFRACRACPRHGRAGAAGNREAAPRRPW